MFNKKSQGNKIINRAGGKAYKQSLEQELIGLVLTSFMGDKFYENNRVRLKRIKRVAEKMKDRLFLAQAAVYARQEWGMRSVSHVLAAHIGKLVKGRKWTKRFFYKVVYRPDDILEIVSFYLNYFKGPIPNSMKKGLARALNKFDGYQLAKYRGEGRAVKMVDVFNLFHPRPNKDNEKMFRDLMGSKLKSNKTWEAALSKTGQGGASREEKKEKKKMAWGELVLSGKIGYFALLRNVRNILRNSDERVKDAVYERLQNKHLIKKSKILPFRYQTAYRELKKIAGADKMLRAVNIAAEIALENVPVFSGKTLVALDESGSMEGRPWNIGSLFAACIVKCNMDADLRLFSNEYRDISINRKTPVLEITESLKMKGGGTNFRKIFQNLREKYDRIIILSDMQGWMEEGFTNSGDILKRDFREYKKEIGGDPCVYSFDLAGYGDMKFPEDKVYCLAGFSEKIFNIMAILEQDRKALINEIKKVRI